MVAGMFKIHSKGGETVSSSRQSETLNNPVIFVTSRQFRSSVAIESKQRQLTSIYWEVRMFSVSKMSSGADNHDALSSSDST